VIIPSFAVERAQEVIYSLSLLVKDGRLPKDMPIFLDSPLAIQATEIFRRHPEYLDQEAQRLMQGQEDPFSLPQLHYTLTTQESMAVNSFRGPAVIISASGMADAGRIKHHLRHNLWRDGASVVFVGFQAQGTPGRKIVDGARKIRIFNEEVAVRARVFTINGFSAHAGQSQILEWLSHFETKNLQVFLVHGEVSAQQTLAGLIQQRFGCPVFIPDYLEEITVEPGEKWRRAEKGEKAAPHIDWADLWGDLKTQLSAIRNRQTQIENKSWAEQIELRDRLLELKRNMADISAEI